MSFRGLESRLYCETSVGFPQTVIRFETTRIFLNSLTQDSKMAAKIAWQVGRVKRFYVIVECEKESSSETESQ